MWRALEEGTHCKALLALYMCMHGHAYLHTQMYTHGNNTGIHTVWPRLAWKLMILLPQCYDYRLESHMGEGGGRE